MMKGGNEQNKRKTKKIKTGKKPARRFCDKDNGLIGGGWQNRVEGSQALIVTVKKTETDADRPKGTKGRGMRQKRLELRISEHLRENTRKNG